jgi:hypothetical protein
LHVFFKKNNLTSFVVNFDTKLLHHLYGNHLHISREPYTSFLYSVCDTFVSIHTYPMLGIQLFENVEFPWKCEEIPTEAPNSAFRMITLLGVISYIIHRDHILT